MPADFLGALARHPMHFVLQFLCVQILVAVSISPKDERIFVCNYMCLVKYLNKN